MNILHVFKTYFPDSFGGVEQVIRTIAKGTGPFGCTSTVFSLSENPQQQQILVDNSTTVKAKITFDIASTGVSIDAFSVFRRLARKAHIIHYHYPWPFMDLLHLGTRPQAPSLITYHSDIVRQSRVEVLYNPLRRAFFNSVNTIVATSDNLLATSPVLQHIKTKVEVIPIGIDESTVAPATAATLARLEAQLGCGFILFVGMLRYYKGLETLLKAALSYPGRIVIVGSGDDEAHYRAMAESLGAANVVFLGRVSEDEKAALHMLSLAFVFPSDLRSEAYGVALAEAAGHGKAMISCELGTGTSFVNIHSVTGIVVPPKNAQALADAMLELYLNSKLAKKMGLAARAHFEKHLRAEDMARKYSVLYQKLARPK